MSGTLQPNSSDALLMAVDVMHIRRVRMAVHERFACRIIRTVRVLVVFVMHVRMGMLERLMFVFVTVMLGEVQPDTYSHK